MNPEEKAMAKVEETMRVGYDPEKQNGFHTSEQVENDNNDGEDEKNSSLTLQLVEEIQSEQIIFFHNEHKEGFAAIKGDGQVIHKVNSKNFKQYLAFLIYHKSKKIISSNTINNVVQMLEGRAIFDGPCYQLDVRITKRDNVIWYDLSDGRAISIDKDGWSINNSPPILFRRYKHQQAQITPERGGNLMGLCDFVNLKSDEDKLLFLVLTVAAFIPGFPHPILVFHGPQGSGKTTPQRLLKSLVDPSALKELSAPDNEREFVQIASHHYFVFFDNLPLLPEWLSNSFSKAVTGSGFSKRELYSDDDDIIYSFKRVIALNGINLVVQKADLLERSVLIGLERIGKVQRKTEEELLSEFEQKKAYLFGALLDAVAGALREHPLIQLLEYPRMADFTQWGCAIAKYLGYTEEEFLNAYYNNLAKQNTEAIDASPLATAVMALVDKLSSWAGTASELHRELQELAGELKIDTKVTEWPKDASSLSRKLNLVETNLAEEGIQISRNDKVRPKRISIQKVGDSLDNPVIPTKPTNNEAGDGMLVSEVITENLNTNASITNQPLFDGVSGLSGNPFSSDSN